jgi:hypothetical protein
MTEKCAFHPDHIAAEHCELCGKPMCGLCLWYGEDGRRFCEQHAQEQKSAGLQVLPPETYAEAVPNSLIVSATSGASPGVSNDIPYKGNRQDLQALIAFVVAITTLVSCFGGIYCLPFVSAGLAIAALANATKALDARRTRQMAGTSLAIGGLMLFCILSYAGLMLAFLVVSIVSSSGP